MYISSLTSLALGSIRSTLFIFFTVVNLHIYSHDIGIMYHTKLLNRKFSKKSFETKL